MTVAIPPLAHRLHTSKRMHFIEDDIIAFDARLKTGLAYVKTYALH